MTASEFQLQKWSKASEVANYPAVRCCRPVLSVGVGAARSVAMAGLGLATAWLWSLLLLGGCHGGNLAIIRDWTDNDPDLDCQQNEAFL